MAKETLITFVNNPLTQLNEMLSKEYPDVMANIDVLFTSHRAVKDVAIHQTAAGRYEIIVPTHHRHWFSLKPTTLEQIIKDICFAVSTILYGSIKESYNCHIQLLQHFNQYSEESANAIINDIVNQHDHTTVGEIFDL